SLSRNDVQLAQPFADDTRRAPGDRLVARGRDRGRGRGVRSRDRVHSDRGQAGAVQKLYYLHFPTALGASIAVSLTALASIVSVWLHDERADRLAEASAEVGAMFLVVVMTMGSIWGHVIWGTWWAWWDPRLALTLFLWFVVVAYLVLRGAVEDP